MFEAFADWIGLTFPNDKQGTQGGYMHWRGPWVDSPALKPRRILVIIPMGGPAPNVEDRRKRFQVIMLGIENNRADSVQVGKDIELLADAALGNSRPCGAASVRAMGEPTGPGFTTENRAFYMLDFEVIF